MKDDSLGCKTMRCIEAQIKGLSHNRGYWCCAGCDDADCTYRCMNDRAICGVASDISRKYTHRTRWSVQEIKILCEHYKSNNVEEMTALLPGRNWLSIKDKAARLGLTKKKEEQHGADQIRDPR